MKWQRIRQRLVRTLPIESGQSYLKLLGLLQLAAEKFPRLESRRVYIDLLDKIGADLQPADLSSYEHANTWQSSL